MNVIEHVENDFGHIAEVSSLMKTGRVIVFAPAMKILYGSMDEQAGHFRRYTKARIREVMERNSMRIIKLSYFNSVGAAGWFVTNKLLRMKLNSSASGKLALIYDSIGVPLVKLVDPMLSKCFGQSILCVAEKR
jgi:hypothetical protein